MSFNLHFADHPAAFRGRPRHLPLVGLISALLLVLALMLSDAALTGGANVRAFHHSVAKVLP